jgi:hypothetical protein
VALKDDYKDAWSYPEVAREQLYMVATGRSRPVAYVCFVLLATAKSGSYALQSKSTRSPWPPLSHSRSSGS